MMEHQSEGHLEEFGTDSVNYFDDIVVPIYSEFQLLTVTPDQVKSKNLYFKFHYNAKTDIFQNVIINKMMS